MVKWTAGPAFCVILLLLLPAPALARKVTVDFKVDPPDARVYCQYGFLGQADKPIQITLDEFGQGNIDLRFEREGYETVTNAVASFTFMSERQTYPLQGAIVLKPQSLSAYLARHQVLLMALGFPALIAMLMAAHLMRKSRRALIKMERFEELVAQGTEVTGITSSTVGDWQIVREIGGGGMARVYQAVPRDSLRDTDAVAIKIIQSDLAADKEFDERFRREIRVCQTLDHKNIVRLYDYGETEGRKYLVMELVRGQTLRQRLRKGGMAPLEMLRYVEPLFSGVAYAHARGVVHRDLKPENIMINDKEELKVLDFGLARRMSESDKLTNTGTALGTPVYMAPEQIKHSAFEPATDQYALGVIAYEMLVGHPPFQADDAMQVLFLHLADFAPAPSEMRPGVPQSVDKVMLRMLAKDPRERYPTVEQAMQDLVQMLRAWGKE